MGKTKELQEILDNIKRQEMAKRPELQAARKDKYTMTPFGKVWR